MEKTLSEDYCSYEVSRLLEEKEFPFIEHLFMYVDKSGRFMTDHYACLTLSVEEYCKHFDELFAPTITHQMAMKWLREVYNIHIVILPAFAVNGVEDDKNYVWEIAGRYRIGTADSFSEAVDAALKYCLTNLINNETN